MKVSFEVLAGVSIGGDDDVAVPVRRTRVSWVLFYHERETHCTTWYGRFSLFSEEES